MNTYKIIEVTAGSYFEDFDPRGFILKTRDPLKARRFPDYALPVMEHLIKELRTRDMFRDTITVSISFNSDRRTDGDN